MIIYIYYIHIHMFILCTHTDSRSSASDWSMLDAMPQGTSFITSMGHCWRAPHPGLTNSFSRDRFANPVISVYLGDTNRENTTDTFRETADEAFLEVWITNSQWTTPTSSKGCPMVSTGKSFPISRPSWLLGFWGALNSANGERDNSEEINILDAVNSTEKNRHSNPNNWQCKI